MTDSIERETISAKLSGLGEADLQWLAALLHDPVHDDAFLEGLHHYLDAAANARFLNALKLEKSGEWLGNTAPDRMQIRLMEAARSSQHPAYLSFRTGLSRSGGLERAYPKAAI
ncbi:hypothetical protein NOF55_21975 [Rhizobiaceae bacterium BDR2-2]|uniref:Uncharacterized protein n=1 Tax=Ectorhizobium quercum TaxID=2965071 RepID=A0AAE3N3X5_9HYPH|nr:hypothetical protein [Ectorhizobium quercum]MCX8999776.1 hypothetical protein [Ectorhizobium quercum]